MKIDATPLTPISSFRPFEVTIKIETEADARLIYHTFNRANLASVLKADIYFNLYDRSLPMTESFGDYGWGKIGKFLPSL